MKKRTKSKKTKPKIKANYKIKRSIINVNAPEKGTFSNLAELNDKLGKQEIEIPLEKKSKEKDSRIFVKCRNLMEKSIKAIDSGNSYKAGRKYLKAREIYIKLELEEQKRIYIDLVDNYKKIKK